MTNHREVAASEPAALDAAGRLTLFGHEATPASVRLLPRSRRWRTLRALRVLGAGLVLSPLVALVPPHAPWLIGALAGSAFLARRRLRERVTLLGLEGTCPRCGEPVRVEGPTRLRRPHPVPCDGCHHESALEVDEPRADRDLADPADPAAA